MDEHNKYRSLHCVPDLTLDEKINESAQKYAEHLVKINRLEHSTNENDYGENLFYSSSSNKLENFDGKILIFFFFSNLFFF